MRVISTAIALTKEAKLPGATMAPAIRFFIYAVAYGAAAVSRTVGLMRMADAQQQEKCKTCFH